jgi:hypothetical protein
MPNDLITLIDSIPDRQPAQVVLTNTGGKRIQAPGVFKVSTAPSFFLLFPVGTLPEKIDADRPCAMVSRDRRGKTVTFAAKIVDIPSTRVIELIADKSLRPEDLREYFRVNIKAPVEVFYDSQNDDEDEEAAELGGETVDISQTGVLAILTDECRSNKPVIIELKLPNPAELVTCSGRVVRSKRLRHNRWLTSFHFDNISSSAQDIIAKNCFAEQRRQLRENVQTAE